MSCLYVSGSFSYLGFGEQLNPTGVVDEQGWSDFIPNFAKKSGEPNAELCRLTAGDYFTFHTAKRYAALSL